MFRRDGLALTNIILDNEIDGVIVWNGVTGSIANALRVLTNSRVLSGGFIERGFLPGSVFFDSDGTNGASSISNGIKDLYAEVDIQKSIVNQKNMIEDRFSISKLSRNKRYNKIIFVPLQVQLDSNILLYSERIKTMRQLAIEACCLAKRMGPDWKVIIRDHPEEEDSNLNLAYSDIMYRDNVTSLDDLIDIASVIYTVNSTVGLTSVLKGKVVICCGKGNYCSEQFVIQNTDNNIDKISETVLSALNEEINIESIIEYMSVFFDRHHIVDVDYQYNDYLPNALCMFGSKLVPDSTSPILTVMQSRMREVIKRSGTPILVEAAFPFTEQVQLTYRKKVSVTKRLISDFLKNNYKDISFSWNIADGDADYDNDRRGRTILIVGSTSKPPSNYGEYLAVLDEIAMPHLACYNPVVFTPG